MLLSLIGTLIVLGLVLYLIETFIPLAAPFPTAIRIVFGIIALVLVLQALGIPVLGLHTTL